MDNTYDSILKKLQGMPRFARIIYFVETEEVRSFTSVTNHEGTDYLTGQTPDDCFPWGHGTIPKEATFKGPYLPGEKIITLEEIKKLVPNKGDSLFLWVKELHGSPDLCKMVHCTSAGKSAYYYFTPSGGWGFPAHSHHTFYVVEEPEEPEVKKTTGKKKREALKRNPRVPKVTSPC